MDNKVRMPTKPKILYKQVVEKQSLLHPMVIQAFNKNNSSHLVISCWKAIYRNDPQFWFLLKELKITEKEHVGTRVDDCVAAGNSRIGAGDGKVKMLLVSETRNGERKVHDLSVDEFNKLKEDGHRVVLLQ